MINTVSLPGTAAIPSLSERFLKSKSLSLKAAFLLVIVLGILSHWPALLSDSIMWDDWIRLAWITQERLDWAFEFYKNYGVTPYLLIDFPFVIFIHHTPTAIFTAKVIYFLGVILNAGLILLISRKVAHGNMIFATLAGISAVCFPALSGEGFHLSALLYYFFIPLFLIGIYIFILVASSPKPKFVIRIIALIFLLLSFSLNSLLVLFYALVPAVFYASLQDEAQSLRYLWTNTRLFLIRHLDFLVTPLVFWILKEIFMPRSGIYLRYNEMRFDWIGILHAYERLIPDILQTTLFVPLSIPFASWAAVGIFVLVILLSNDNNTAFKNKVGLSKGGLIILFGLGLFTLLSAALPYYIVGRRSFEAFGFMSRDNVLFPLPVSWLTAALFCILLKLETLLQTKQRWNLKLLWKRMVLAVFAALITLQSLSNWRNQADWQAHYALYRSAGEKIAQDNLVNQASVIQVIDKLPGDRSLRTWKYPTSIWTEIISAVFQKTSRLGLPMPPENGLFFTGEELRRRVRETEADFMLRDINLDGQQIKLTIEPTSNIQSPIRLALAYWRARFFVPSDMPKLLDSLTQIKSEPIVSE